jgi:hypothetical protein
MTDVRSGILVVACPIRLEKSPISGDDRIVCSRIIDGSEAVKSVPRPFPTSAFRGRFVGQRDFILDS